MIRGPATSSSTSREYTAPCRHCWTDEHAGPGVGVIFLRCRRCWEPVGPSSTEAAVPCTAAAAARRRPQRVVGRGDQDLVVVVEERARVAIMISSDAPLPRKTSSRASPRHSGAPGRPDRPPCDPRTDPRVVVALRTCRLWMTLVRTSSGLEAERRDRASSAGSAPSSSKRFGCRGRAADVVRRRPAWWTAGRAPSTVSTSGVAELRRALRASSCCPARVDMRRGVPTASSGRGRLKVVMAGSSAQAARAWSSVVVDLGRLDLVLRRRVQDFAERQVHPIPALGSATERCRHCPCPRILATVNMPPSRVTTSRFALVARATW